jgi:hypothetical protein
VTRIVSSACVALVLAAFVAGSVATPAVAAVGTPSAPAITLLETNDRQAAVHWRAAAPNGSRVTTYRIWIRSYDRVTKRYSRFAVQNVSAGSRRHIWTRVRNGLIYDVRIAAVNKRGTGAQSAKQALVRPRPVSAGVLRPVSPDARVFNALAPAGRTVTVRVAGRGGIPATGVRYVSIAATIAGTGTSGRVWLWPGGRTKPLLASVGATAEAGAIHAQRIVRVGSNGTISLAASTSHHVILEVTAYSR